MKKSNKILSLLLALVMLITSCSVSMFAFAADGYQVTGKTDKNNRWSYKPDTAVSTAADNLWSTASIALSALPAFEGISFSDGLDDLANKKLYTNAMIANLYQLYGVIGKANDGQFEMLAELACASIASCMPEEKYADARAVFDNAIQNKGEAHYYEAVCAAAKEIPNFGFTDGDRAGFEDAVLVALRPVTYTALSLLQADTKVQYEAIYPVLVAFGVDNVQSIDDFNTAYDESTEDKAIKADLAWRPVFDALFDFYDNNFKPNPVKGLLNVLPNIANVIESGAADTFIKKIVNSLLDLNEDITKLKALVNSMTFDSATINGFFANKELKFADGAIVVVVDPIPFGDLASVIDYAPADKLDAVFEIFMKTVTTEVFGEKTAYVKDTKYDENGDPVYVVDGEGNPTDEVETITVEKKYNNWTFLAPLLVQYASVVESVVPGAVEALNTANAAVNAGDVTTAYNEVSGIIFRTFAKIKRVRLIVDGEVVESYFTRDNGKVELDVPADKITKATSAKSGHVINGVLAKVPERAVDDVDVKVGDRTEACTFASKVTKAATYTAAGVMTHTCTKCGYSYTTAIPKLAKKANPLKVKAKAVTVKFASLKKKNQTIAVKKYAKITGAQGAVTYTKKSGDKKITVNKKTGKITIKKKGLKKGKTYKVKIAVKAAGNTQYNAATKMVTIKIKVK